MPDLNKIIEDLSSLTVAEAAELSKQLEEKCSRWCSSSRRKR
jgi:large subunit ribosomal protein L7/L12